MNKTDKAQCEKIVRGLMRALYIERIGNDPTDELIETFYDNDRMLNRYESMLIAEYERQIESDFDWYWLVRETQNYLEPAIGYNERVGRIFIGTVLQLNPSGKYWVSWTRDNVTDVEALKDECFNEALENVANRHGGWIESGEGDPLDQYFCKTYED